MRLTASPYSHEKPSTKVHAKHLRRLKELRLQRRLLGEYLVDLEHFSGLRRLSLDAGTDSLATFAAISAHVRAPLPLDVDIGLNCSDPPVFPERPEVRSISLPVNSAAEPLAIEHATRAVIRLVAGARVPDFSVWKSLEALDLEVEPGVLARHICHPKSLQILGVRLGLGGVWLGAADAGGFGPWSIEWSRGLLGGEAVRLAGDLDGFTEVFIGKRTVFAGQPLPRVRTLSVKYAPLDEAEIRRYLGSAPAAEILHLTLAEQVDYAGIVQSHPRLKQLAFDLPGPEYRGVVEQLAAELKAIGCRTTASIDGGPFIVDLFDSDDGTWRSDTTR